MRRVLMAGTFVGAEARFQRLKDAINGTADPNIVIPNSVLATEGVFVKREAVLLTTVA